MSILKTFIRSLATERSLNRITLVGRVGADAILKGTFEHPVVIFNVATSSDQKTEWHKVSVFEPRLRTLAETYVKSGIRLLVEGRLSHGHVVDKQGQAVPATSIIANDIIFLSKSNS